MIKNISIIGIIVIVVASLAIVAIAKYQRVVQPAIRHGLAAATGSGDALANLGNERSKTDKAKVKWTGDKASLERAKDALAAALGIEKAQRVREAIMTALMRVGNEASVRTLLPYIRSQDAGQRACGFGGRGGTVAKRAVHLA